MDFHYHFTNHLPRERGLYPLYDGKCVWQWYPTDKSIDIANDLTEKIESIRTLLKEGYEIAEANNIDDAWIMAVEEVFGE